MKLSEYKLSSIEPTGSQRLDVTFVLETGEPLTLYFEVRNACAISDVAIQDCLYVLGSSTAYWFGESYAQTQPVDLRLIDNTSAAHKEWKHWQGAPKDFHNAIVPREVSAAKSSDGRANAIFFSGGVDSFFTLLDSPNSDLCTISIEHEPIRSVEIETAFKKLNELADMSQASGSHSAISIVTNMMTCHPRILDQWALKLHGAFLAACAHLVSDTVASASISSTFTYGSLKAWGSHPLLDPLWSSSRLAIQHYGATHTRLQKTRMIAGSQTVRSSLSVCEYGRYSRGETLNCSECVKCSRTMLTLDALGFTPEEATAFNWSNYSMETVRQQFIRGPGEARLLNEIIDLSIQNGRTDIADAISHAIDRSRFLMWLTSVERFIRRKFPWILQHKTVLRRTRNKVIQVFGFKFV